MLDEIIVFDFRMRTQNVLEEVLWAQVKVEELHFMIVRRCEGVDANLKEIKDKMATVVSWESRKPESGKKFFK